VKSQNIASTSLQDNAHQIDIDTLAAENVAESLAFPVAVQELEELCHVEAVRAAEEDAGVSSRPGAQPLLPKPHVPEAAAANQEGGFRGSFNQLPGTFGEVYTFVWS
jgi:hypothetical protein